MKYAAIALLLTVGACAPEQPLPHGGALATTYELYKQCLAALPPEQCETPRARFEAERAYADSVSRRAAVTQPPIVIQAAPQQPAYEPIGVRTGITCTTLGNITRCR